MTSQSVIGRFEKVLCLKADKNDGRLVIYYQCDDGAIRRLKPSKRIFEREREIAGYIETRRFLQGDPDSYPDERVAAIYEVNVSHFYEMGDKLRQEYVEGLELLWAGAEIEKHSLEEIELKFEAGILKEDDPGLISYLKRWRF